MEGALLYGSVRAGIRAYRLWRNRQRRAQLTPAPADSRTGPVESGSRLQAQRLQTLLDLRQRQLGLRRAARAFPAGARRVLVPQVRSDGCGDAAEHA